MGSWNERSTKTSRQLIWNGSFQELQDIYLPLEHNLCLCNGKSSQSSLRVFMPHHDKKKKKDMKRMLGCIRGIPFKPPSWPNSQTKERKDVTEEAVIVKHHPKPVLKDIKGKQQRTVCSFWSNTPWRCLQSIKGFFFPTTRYLLSSAANSYSEAARAFVHESWLFSHKEPINCKMLEPVGIVAP